MGRLFSQSNDLMGNTSAILDKAPVVTYTYDTQDRIATDSSGNNYSFDTDGFIQSITNTAGSQTFNYDVLGSLRSVTMPSGDVISYLSNSQGKRVVRKKNGAITAYYLYQSGSQIGAVLDSSGNLLQSFVYGSNPLVPDYMIISGVEYRIITDWRGSVRLVVNSATGAFVQRIDYDEFGQILTDSNPGFQPFGFAGGIYDVDTKLTRFGVREYSPSIGRWLSKDPIGFGGGQANLYGYTFNDPINFIDPLGKNADIPTYNQMFNQLGTDIINASVDLYKSYTTTALGIVGVAGTAAVAPQAYVYCSLNPGICMEFASGVAGGIMQATNHGTNTPSTSLSNVLGSFVGEKIGDRINQCSPSSK